MVDLNDKGNLEGWTVLIFFIVPFIISISILFFLKIKEFIREILTNCVLSHTNKAKTTTE